MIFGQLKMTLNMRKLKVFVRPLKGGSRRSTKLKKNVSINWFKQLKKKILCYLQLHNKAKMLSRVEKSLSSKYSSKQLLELCLI